MGYGKKTYEIKMKDKRLLLYGHSPIICNPIVIDAHI